MRNVDLMDVSWNRSLMICCGLEPRWRHRCSVSRCFHHFIHFPIQFFPPIDSSVADANDDNDDDDDDNVDDDDNNNVEDDANDDDDVDFNNVDDGKVVNVSFNY